MSDLLAVDNLADRQAHGEHPRYESADAPGYATRPAGLRSAMVRFRLNQR